jgi:hypothetical protein
MSLFPIFKVNKLTERNKTDIIYVFFGTNLDIENPNELFKRDPNNKAFEDIFNNTELKNIRENLIRVEFLKQSIHIDDSIGVIKLKIFEALRKSVSMSEIYLFCLKNEKLNPITVYQNLTQNDHLPLTKIRLEQLLKNIYDEDGDPIEFSLPKKNKYTFDDILNLDLTDRNYLVAKILGQKFVFNHEYPFIADPFYVTEYDALLENSRRELTSLSNSLLLESFPIFQNTIFLCVAPDVFSSIKKTDVSIEYTCKLYFPFLYQDNIDSIEKLDNNRDKLIEETSNKLTSNVQKGFESVNMFYDIFQYKKASKKFTEKRQSTGIKSIKIIMHPEFLIKIPIDVIFKLIHATKDFPLIKFNPETRQENIYRLYTEQMTMDGRKIPFLNKAIIFKLIKNIGKSKSVAVYTNIVFEGIQYYMACEFADNGSITVYPLTEFEEPIFFNENSYNTIDNILSLAVNPLIEQIKPFFEQSGLEIPLFTSIKSINVEIREITYQTVYSISKPVEINKYIGCVSSIFTIESADLKRGIEMRFKRVANFNKRDSQEAFIIEKIDQGLKFDEIVDELVQNYNDVDDETAADLIAKIRSELEVTRGANRRRALMIKINPGFKTRISLNSIVSEITVTVEGINDIFYLNTIPVYIDSLIRITQDKSSSQFSANGITKLCSGKEVEDIEFGQITAVAEKNIEENQVPDILEESPVYSIQKPGSGEIRMGENMDDLLDMLAFDDDDDIIESNSKGGNSSSDSGESVKTPSLSSSDSDPNVGEFVNKSVAVPTSKKMSSIESSSSSSDSGESVKTPSVSSSDSGESVKTPSVSSSDSGESVKTPSVSSSVSDPNLGEFIEKPLEVPTSKKATSIESSSSSSDSGESIKTPSLRSSSEKKEEIVKPIVNVEVNINKPPTPLKEVEIEEEVVMPPRKEVEIEEEVVMPTKKGRPKKEKKIEEEVVIPPRKEVEIEEEVLLPPRKEVEIEEEVVLPTKKGRPKKEKKIEETQEELENTIRDITGMKLRYPNPFSARLEKRAPQLFVREKNDKIDVYTRMCPFSLSDRRQPVILSKKEKDELIEEHPDINQESDFIEYSTDPIDSSKKFYYTCPRFWCMLTDKMVTEQDILDGKCGPKVKRVEDAIIPKAADAVKNDNRYVYQFYDEDDKKYPGFHKKKTPTGLCIPCCYNKWSTEEMKNRRDLCQGKFDETKAQTVSGEEQEFEEQVKRDIQYAENYVKGPEKYGPQLGENRWGFLPISVQKFLHEVNEDCQISKMNPNLKPNHTCILRHGVEINSQQSFIACIASAMFYGQKAGPNERDPPLITKFIPNAKYDVPSIEEMKNKVIIPAINIDKFVKYQNGDLITSFADIDAKVDINKPEYTGSKLYKKIKESKDLYNTLERTFDNDTGKLVEDSIPVKTSSIEFFTKAVQSYENFIRFLKDPKIYIDYTYLWDLICTPNPNLFEAGINLIILEMPEDDVSNNIELVCPTNRYSTHIYDARKRSLILIKRENYFEPIYGYRNDLERDEIQITKTFSEYDRKLPKSLRAVFTKIIKPTLGNRCKAFPSNLDYIQEYKFKHPPLLDNLIVELMEKRYTDIIQVLSFQGKVIGLLAKSHTSKEGFIPCYPSSLTILKNSSKYSKKSCDLESKCEFDFVYVSDKIWKPYEETLEFLKEYYDYKEPDHELETKDYFGKNSFCKVVNNELIIGFLTNTNQFIRILDPIPISLISDNIGYITNNDMLVADIETINSLNVDTERSDFIKRIQLETNFYNVFRNTIRILFNDYSNSEKRKNIQSEASKRYILYRQQVNKVVDMLHDLVGESIKFSSQSKDGSNGFNYKNINENEIHNCIKLSKDNCGNKDEFGKGICQITDNTCSLILPKNNLVTGNDNEDFYYGRMADELIRYNRIKSFIFKPQAYLSFGQIKYNLRENEMLMLQDLITQEFFENLIPADINKYARYNTYDTAEPILSQSYKKDFELDEIINPNYVRDCFPSDPTVIKSIKWKNCFPSNYKEISYTGSSKLCSLYLIIDLIKKFKGIELTVEEIKDTLIDQYKLLTENYKNIKKITSIINILREEGQFDANQLQDGTMNFEQMILQEGFGAVNFDLWVLLVKYEIPSIFISSKLIPETRFKRYEFVCYLNENHENTFAFIVIPAMYKRQGLKNPEYKLIVNENNQVNISLRSLKDRECLENIEEAINKVYSISTYIDEIFVKRNTTKHPARKQDAINIEFVEISKTPPEEQIIYSSVEKEEKEEEKPKIVKLKKSRKLKNNIILEEELEENEKEIPLISNKDINMEEEFEIELPRSDENKGKKIKKTYKKNKLKVNPLKKTKKKMSI